MLQVYVIFSLFFKIWLTELTLIFREYRWKETNIIFTWLSSLYNPFNETVLAFLSVESKTKILYVNINMTGSLLSGFGRHCGKIVPEPAIFHLFWAPVLSNNFFSIFFSRWPVANNSRNKRVSALLLYHGDIILKSPWLYFIGFETIYFYLFFIKMSHFRSNLFFQK